VRQAAALFRGVVIHHRMKPRSHRFRYRVFNLLIDLDRLGEADRQSWLFSIGRFNLMAFQPADHGPEDGSDLAAHARRLLRDAGLETDISRIDLLCYPRMLGFVFNPISVYFAYDAAEAVAGVIYEVRNTFGEMHTYVAPVKPGEWSEAGLRQQRDKLFYVSPFMDMPMRYHFRLRPPGDEVAIRILETDREGPILAALFHGKHQTLTDQSVFSACLRFPFMTLKVVLGIHYEAARLWFKGIRFFARPPAPPAVSIDGHFAKSEMSGRRR
jgi:uncharacterized protein